MTHWSDPVTLWAVDFDMLQSAKTFSSTKFLKLPLDYDYSTTTTETTT